VKLRAPTPLDGDSPLATRQFRPWQRRLTAAALWVLIGTAALGGLVGLVRQEPTAQVPTNDAPTTLPAGADGFAELAVSAWLSSTPTTQSEATAFFIGDVPVPAIADGLVVGQISAVGWRASEDDTWAITVAAVFETADGLQRSIWYLEVTVIGEAGRYQAAGAPALLPSRLVSSGQPGRSFDRPMTSDPIAVTVSGFLDSFLAANGDVARYAAPGSNISAVVPTPCASTSLRGIETQASTDTARVHAQVECSAGDDAWTFEYEVVLGLRDGRWEVRSVGSPSAPAATTSRTGTSPTSTTGSIASEPGA
jgi:hypothetical protein